MKRLKVKINHKKNIKIAYHPDYIYAINDLISKVNKEVAWYTTISKEVQNNITIFRINPEIIIPEQVSGAANVQSFEKEEKDGSLIEPNAISRAIKEDIPEKNRKDFNLKMRLHGHSHVNMGTSWSDTDQNHYAKLAQNLPYHIGHIANKHGDHSFYYQDSEIPDNDSDKPFTNFPTIELLETKCYFKMGEDVSMLMDKPSLLDYITWAIKNRIKEPPKTVNSNIPAFNYKPKQHNQNQQRSIDIDPEVRDNDLRNDIFY